MSRIVLFAGAPDLSALRENELTINDWLAPFAAVLGHPPGSVEPQADVATLAANVPAWRVVPVNPTHLPTGWSQPGWLYHAFADPELQNGAHRSHDEDNLSFYSTISPCFDRKGLNVYCDPADDNGDDALSQFLEHSFAVHEEVHSSQITSADALTPLPRRPRRRRITLSTAASDSADPSDSDPDTSSFASSAFHDHTPNSFASSLRTPLSLLRPNTKTASALPTPLIAPQLRDLSALPPAAHLSAIQPQTITVDLIAGIISVSPARTVEVRSSGRLVDMIELLLGDETRAGFGVTFWVAPLPDDTPDGAGGAKGPKAAMAAADSARRQTLEGLRAGDVVLFRNVALRQFRHVTYGQSLGRRAGWRSETMVRLLWRAGDACSLGYGDDAGRGPLALKVERVREWTRMFVRAAGSGVLVERDKGGRGGKRRKVLTREELPPDDTPVR